MYNLDVVIIGGGIAGLSTGIFLVKGGYNVHVYEQAEVILPVGAAISVWSNGVKVLNLLGVGEQTKKLGGQMDKMIYRDLNDEVMTTMDLKNLYKNVGARAYPVARGDLQQMLMDEYVRVGGKLTLGKICTEIEEVGGNKVVAHFNDGSKSIPCHLLVGADGVKSKVREYVLAEKAKDFEPIYQYTNWNGLIELDESIAGRDEWVMWVGEGKRASVMPVADNRFYFFFGNNMPQERKYASKEELYEIFKNFPEKVKKIVKAMDIKKTNRIPICDLDSLPTYVRKNVVLIGDSAHGTTPTLGQGGCQALEDAQILSTCLLMHDVSVNDCLIRYERFRKERSQLLVTKARERTNTIFGLNGMAETNAWYQELRQSDIGHKILDGMEKNLRAGPLAEPTSNL